METWLINGCTVEYDEETHTYLADGVIVPSVTQVMGVKFWKKYAGIDKEVLNRAASRGTAIHAAIEMYCRYGYDDGSKEVHNFNFLLKRKSLKVVENEVPIVIFEDNKPKAAGRLDLILSDEQGETMAVADIKTTSVLDIEYLTYQLNLYRIGYMQSYNKDIKDLYGVHLREDKRKIVKVSLNESCAWDILTQWKGANNE